MSSDGVFFYCASTVLRACSSNQFGRALTTDPPLVHNAPEQATARLPLIKIEDSSPVLNIILHVAYAISFERYGHSLQMLTHTLNRFPYYGISTTAGNLTFWAAVLRFCPTDPLRVYAFAAAHAQDAVCVTASEHTLKHGIDGLKERDAIMMGPIYLRRLIFLHCGRRAALMRIISDPPRTHAPTVYCSTGDQAELARRWAVEVAKLIVQPSPHNMPPDSLDNAFRDLAQGSPCERCNEYTNSRTADLVKQWREVKRTI
ncbi:hypothetical protein FRB94_003116 [Tulasnella sp. JGI-2019a]|nr:hypothetical protein FRB94_003116 [Tulasnella sp. JGI-2019a]